MSEGVVPPPFVLIAQDGIGFIDLLELFLGDLLFLLPGQGIRVVLAREPSKGFLKLVIIGVFVYAQDVVIVPFHHVEHRSL